jgi:pyroglutamyl-peptidase
VGVFLITGFDWYRGVDYVFYHPNPSGIIASMMDNRRYRGYLIRGVVLSVDYSSIKYLRRILEELKPVGVIGLGLHPRTDKPLIEPVAVNVMYEGDSIKEIIRGGKLFIHSGINPHDLYKYLKRKGFSVRVSNTSGTYLCNAVAYTIYEYSNQRGSKSVFLHIPPAGILKHRLGYSWVNEWSINRLVELVYAVIDYMVREDSENSS